MRTKVRQKNKIRSEKVGKRNAAAKEAIYRVLVRLIPLRFIGMKYRADLQPLLLGR